MADFPTRMMEEVAKLERRIVGLEYNMKTMAKMNLKILDELRELREQLGCHSSSKDTSTHSTPPSTE
jgi:uncharacterized protein with PhoU and TrkA domain